MKNHSSGTTRREFLGTSGILLSCLVGSQTLLMSPREARAAGVPLQVLSDVEARTLEAFADLIVPGARVAGIAQFIDKQLSLEGQESLLMIKYLGVPEPFNGFYQSGLNALSELSLRVYGKEWHELDDQESSDLIAKVASNDVGGSDDWAAPPAPFLFFVLRSDACDVVYGTEQGFERIGMPYMAHIQPTYNWQEPK